MKKLFAMALSVMMMGSFAACGGQAPPAQSESIAESAPTTSSASSAAASATSSSAAASATPAVPEEASEASVSDTAEVSSTSAEPVETAASTAPQSPAAPEAVSNTLVVYFSLPEATSPDNLDQEGENSTVIINGELLGNTQYMAYVIQEAAGADIFRIEPVDPYPIDDHRALIDLASEEQAQSARPAIVGQVENMAQYDTVFLGYPNWWGDMPMILYTFLEEYDLSGKTVIPFNTHGGSGFSGTVGTIAELEPGATVSRDGLSISRNSIQDAEADIVAWVRGLGFEQ